VETVEDDDVPDDVLEELVPVPVLEVLVPLEVDDVLGPVGSSLPSHAGMIAMASMARARTNQVTLFFCFTA
jgi:hypothetical protein